MCAAIFCALLFADLPGPCPVSREDVGGVNGICRGVKRPRVYRVQHRTVLLGSSLPSCKRPSAVTTTLLHISVFLFFSGSVIFFFTVYQTIATIVSIALGIFGLEYLILAILPCVVHRSPYRTPLSTVCWYLWHTILISGTLFLRGLLTQLHSSFVPHNLGDVTSSRQRILTQLLETIETSTGKYRGRLKYSFRGVDAHVRVNLKAITWLFNLPALAEIVKGLISRIPGVTIVQLMNGPEDSGWVICRGHLLTLLRGCAPGPAGLDEITRRHWLLTYLNAVLDIVKPSSVRGGPSLSESVVGDVRTNFANIGLMRELWADTDPSIRLISRSICALLARRLLRKPQLEQSELAWLQDVIGKPPLANTTYDALNNLPTLDSMNLDAYICGVLFGQTDDLPIDQATPFMKTLTILSSGGSTPEIVALEGGITAFIQRADEQNNCLREVVGRLCRIYDRHQERRTLIISTG